MDDAYTIGITLALENGVSEGIGIIRRDLQALDLAIGQTMRALTGLRRTSDAGLGSARLDVARLTADGRQALGRPPSMVLPAPGARPAMARLEQPEPLPSAEATTVPRASSTDGFSPTAPVRGREPEALARAMPLSVPPPAFPPLRSDAAAKPALPEVSISAAPLAARSDSGPRTSAALVSPPNPSLASLAPTPSASLGPPASMAPMPPARITPTTADPAIAPVSLASVPLSCGLGAADLAAFVRDLAPHRNEVPVPRPEQSSDRALSAAPRTVATSPRQAFGDAPDRSPRAPQDVLGRVPARQRESEPDAAANAALAPRAPNPLAPTSAALAGNSGVGGRPGGEDRWGAMFRIEGPVTLDGELVGRWMSDRLTREAERAPAGPTGFDPRASRIWPGMATQP